MSVDLLLSSKNGLVVAPAGCGKTHLITETLLVKPYKPYLVLTHTTAGVTALKQRLHRLNVPRAHYIIATIDGWALKLTKMFPLSCPMATIMSDPKILYPTIRKLAFTFISNGNIHDILSATYSRVLVDEYQDCDIDQHNLIISLSKVIPTTILGDPMQAVFNFGNILLPKWQDIEQSFPVLFTLNTPWRWYNSGCAELGEWILNASVMIY